MGREECANMQTKLDELGTVVSEGRKMRTEAPTRVEIAIFPSYGVEQIPERFKADLGWFYLSEGEMRVELAKRLMELPETHQQVTRDDLNNVVREGKNGYVRSGNQFYFQYRHLDAAYEIQVVEVDTSKPWRINKKRGTKEIGEYVEYFESPRILDERLNLATW